MRSRIALHCASLLVATGTFAVSSAALANGFAVARFGGPHGNPTESNPTTLYYNPAGIAFGNGHTQLYLDVNWAYRSSTYERTAESVEVPSYVADEDRQEYIDGLTGEGSVKNLIYSPMLGVTSNFGTDLPFAVGFGFYAPFGGQAVWDQTEPSNNPNYIGVEDGPQRWYTIEGTIRTLALSLGAAYQLEQIRLGLGVSASYYISEIDTIRARNSDGTDDLTNEGRSWLEASGGDIGLGIGLMWEPLEDQLWVGASWQSQPGFGESELEGTLYNYFAEREEGPITLQQALPEIYRLGVRYRPMADLELRLFGDLTRWSSFEQQCIVNPEILAEEGYTIDEVCQFDANGATTGPSARSIVQNLPRNWNDAGGVRVGGSYWFSDAVELMLDLGFDGNAIPDEALEPALFDMNKFSAGIGGRFAVTDFMALNITATDIVYTERDTNGNETASNFAIESRGPNSAGIYNQNIFVLNTGIDFTFGTNRDAATSEDNAASAR